MARTVASSPGSSASGVGPGPRAGDPQPPTADRGLVFTSLRTRPKLSHALTPLAEAMGFNYLSSMSPVQMLAPPHQELTETEVPYPDTDSVGELPTGPDQFAVPHQDLNNKQTQHQKLPEAVPVLDWDQNQSLVLPSRHKKSSPKSTHYAATGLMTLISSLSDIPLYRICRLYETGV
ncbi:leucine-rich repeat-containing protein 37B-like isoform X1 [Delphinapterus leucas]|uniref:Leucine-rich repeat-containing protein 37B-like isoform X1 n=1 Tax=Delphinapterus leucas TaxID=9749 RepID=A0A2Y9MT71_DELLE|nr:leucine-rich repeat-containing protein 37B-like isoform X1 [Delphinapterus leucas]